MVFFMTPMKYLYSTMAVFQVLESVLHKVSALFCMCLHPTAAGGKGEHEDS